MSSPTWSFGFRTVDLNMISTKDFEYPMKGLATCRDWIDRDCCGYGLHYLKDFEGNFSLTEINSLPAVRCQLLKINHKYNGKNNIRSIDGGEKYKSKQVQVLGTFLSLNDMKEFLEKYRTTRVAYKKLILNRLEALICNTDEGKVINKDQFICLNDEIDEVALNGGTAIWNHIDNDNNSDSFYLVDSKSKAVVIRDSECYVLDLWNLPINKSYRIEYNNNKNTYEVV